MVYKLKLIGTQRKQQEKIQIKLKNNFYHKLLILGQDIGDIILKNRLPFLIIPTLGG